MKQSLYFLVLSLLMLYSCTLQAQSIDNFLLGSYCGNTSGGPYSILYYYSSIDSAALYVDSTNSYYRRKRDAPLLHQTPVRDTQKIVWMRDLIKALPDELLHGTDVTRTFGCPDCNDQCGMYLEFVNHQTTYRFYVDTQTNQLDEDMHDYAEQMIQVIRQMSKKK